MRAKISMSKLMAQDMGVAANEALRRQNRAFRQSSRKPSPQFIFDACEDAKGNKVLSFPFMSISDIHLGTRHSRAKRLSHMLENTVADRLMAVGDIVDLEYMRRKPEWNFAPYHRQVLGHLLRKKAHYIAGNHDADLRGTKIVRNDKEMPRREWLGKKIYGMSISDEEIYTDPKGRVIKIEHGDRFDDVAFGRSKNFWYGVGDALHSPIANFDTFVQEKLGCERFSFAAGAKKLTKTVINKGLGVEKEIIRTVETNPAIDGLLYGHSHMGGIKHSPGGKLILNDGCSTEHVQAMVHDRNGAFALITWHKDRLDVEEENGSRYSPSFKELGLSAIHKPAALIEDEHTKNADRLIRVIFRLAPPETGRQPFRRPRVFQVPPHPHRAEQIRRREATHQPV